MPNAGLLYNEEQMEEKYALITGASQGLGRELACQLASRGMNTILAALPGENLEAVRDRCRSFGVRSDCFELDLTDRDSLIEFISRVNADYRLSVLINNAGTGGSRKFDEVPLKYIDTIMKLNVLATTVLTHELLPNLRRNAPSRILNVSSLAALIPTGYKTVYPASKAYIKHFSLGMREEFRPYGISVSLALLGPMPTKQEIIDRINRQGALGSMLSVTPDKVAKTCLDGLFGGRRIIVAGGLNKLSYNLLKLVPEHLKSVLMSRSVAKNEIG